MKKTALVVTIIALALTASLSACASGSTTPSASATPSSVASPSATAASPSPSATPASGEKIFTVTELSTYDGKNGNPAYIAVNGIVYDVSNMPEWSTGSHQGALVGRDLTAAISKAPHGSSILDNVPIVGKLQ